MSACRSCGAEVVWAYTLERKRVPLDIEPEPDAGNLARIGVAADGAPIVTVVPTDVLERVRVFGAVVLEQSHFVTCPDADDWRRPREKGASA